VVRTTITGIFFSDVGDGRKTLMVRPKDTSQRQPTLNLKYELDPQSSLSEIFGPCTTLLSRDVRLLVGGVFC